MRSTRSAERTAITLTIRATARTVPLMRRNLLVVIVSLPGVVWVVGGCGQASTAGSRAGARPTTSTARPSTTVSDGPDSVDFSKPDFSPAVQVATDSIPPSSSLPFPAAFPKVSGTPATVWASDAKTYPKGQALVGVSYDTSSPQGAYFVFEALEQPVPNPESAIRQIAASCTDCTVHKVVPVTAGVDGALLAGPPITGITWIQGAFQLQVMGPADTFSIADAEAVATDLAEQFAPTAASVTKPRR
jgi:hypothetical protein